jgi:hypothetical protein
MQKEIETTAASVTTDEKLAENKIEFARRYAVSKRTVDGWIARGLPHLKLSARMIRIPLPEAADWVKENYLTQL